MKSKNFKNWQMQELHQSFGIDNTFMLDDLTDWLSSQETITELEIKDLEKLRQKAFKNVDYWNEEELKMNFIAPLIQLVNFDGNEYRAFYDRPLSTEINGIRLFGRVDMLVANGFQNPQNPYFCIHEYKQENNREGDPKGQLVSEMLAVQALNNNDNPIYGCYVLARNWYFVVLNGKKYSVSQPYISTLQDGILQIFKMLRYVKTYIVEQNKENRA
jgi:hypothetical protein